MKHFETPTDPGLLFYAEKLDGLMTNWANEIVEFKEAKSSYDTDRIGRYFSALSNEANLRQQQCGWLIFGVSETHDRHLVGSSYKKGDRSLLEKFKYEIARFSTGGITFDEITELELNSGDKARRVLMFRIPAAATGIPTAWHEVYYARAGESLIPLSQDKIDRIRAQERQDWSRQVIPNSSIDQLDRDAIQLARTKYKEKLKGPQAAEEVDQWSDAEFLAKLKLTVDGRLTNAALLLLGKEEHDNLFSMAPKVMWRLYGAGGVDRDYEIFSIPFINVIDKVFEKIRNLTYRYIPNQRTLFPIETQQYEPWLLRELINNCIAHSNYRLGGRIYVNEFEDEILITNPGTFLPETIEKVLEPSYNPPFYLNQLLADTMVKLHMIDTAAMGIRRIFRIQKERYFPMPDYEMNQNYQVAVTVYGKTINDRYTHILYDRPELDLRTIYLLDQIQKGKSIADHDLQILAEPHLIKTENGQILLTDNENQIIIDGTFSGKGTERGTEPGKSGETNTETDTEKGTEIVKSEKTDTEKGTEIVKSEKADAEKGTEIVKAEKTNTEKGTETNISESLNTEIHVETAQNGNPSLETEINGMISQNPSISLADMAKEMGLSIKTVRNRLNKLRIKGRIRRDGAQKNGKWVLIPKEK